jgi:hypothetical protein
MLAVCVERTDILRPALKSELDAGLERGTLAKIRNVIENIRAGPTGQVARLVA